jgi:hypothetical protein
MGLYFSLCAYSQRYLETFSFMQFFLRNCDGNKTNELRNYSGCVIFYPGYYLCAVTIWFGIFAAFAVFFISKMTISKDLKAGKRKKIYNALKLTCILAKSIAFALFIFLICPSGFALGKTISFWAVVGVIGYKWFLRIAPPVVTACVDGDLETLEKYLNSGGDINLKGDLVRAQAYYFITQ